MPVLFNLVLYKAMFVLRVFIPVALYAAEGNDSLFDGLLDGKVKVNWGVFQDEMTASGMDRQHRAGKGRGCQELRLACGLGAQGG